MEKIGDGFRNWPYQPSTKSEDRKSKKTDRSEKTGFLSFFQPKPEVEESTDSRSTFDDKNASEKEIEALLDEVYESGQQLAQNPSPDNIQQYKKRISRFLQIIVAQTVELKEVEGRLRKDMKKPKYALLQVIDEKLDKLGAFVLQNQKDKLEILRKVDELQGLLVDLRH